MARMSITFDGFEKLAAEMDRIGMDLKPAVNEALQETQTDIQTRLESAAEPYENGGVRGWAKGDMYDAIIRDAKVEWEDDYVATVGVGFDLTKKGGFHSIFIMYGVPAHGKFNRGYAKDTKVYNAIRGTRTKNRIKKIQEEVMKRYLRFGR